MRAGNTNQVTFEGNLAWDMRGTLFPKTGTGVIGIKIVNNDTVMTRDGIKEIPTGMKADIFGTLEEIKALQESKRLCTGAAVIVHGKLRPNNWVDKDGQKHFDIVIRCDVAGLTINSQAKRADEEAADNSPDALVDKIDLPF